MEENLEVFSGFMKIGTWTLKYCILRDNILTICQKKGGEIEGKIHLKIAKISEMESLHTTFQIDTGTSQMIFRAENLAIKTKWLNNLFNNKKNVTISRRKHERENKRH